MAELDVGDILLDNMIADPFTITRRIQEVNSKGRLNPTTELIEENDDETPLVGVFTIASPNDLERLDDSQRMGRNFSLVTRVRLYGPSKAASGRQYLPDIVHWQGNDFLVKNVEPYTQYGAVFIQAIVGSQDMVDRPPA